MCVTLFICGCTAVMCVWTQRGFSGITGSSRALSAFKWCNNITRQEIVCKRTIVHKQVVGAIIVAVIYCSIAEHYFGARRGTLDIFIINNKL